MSEGREIEITDQMIEAAAATLLSEMRGAELWGEHEEIAYSVVLEALLSGGWKPYSEESVRGRPQSQAGPEGCSCGPIRDVAALLIP